MGRGEHDRVLLPQRYEIPDVEEPSVVDAGVPLLPPHRSVRLRIEERPVRADTGRSLPLPVPPARAALGDQGFGALGERQPRARDPERRPVLARPDREPARPQHLVHRSGQDGQDDPPLGVRYVPVDVEEPRESRARASAEHVHPPPVLRARGHVVRHHVDHQAHAPGAELGRQAAEPATAAQRRIEPRGIHDVVPVRAPLPRRERRREVQVGDPQPPQVRHQPPGPLEPDPVAELEPVRGAGTPRHQRRPRSSP